MYFSTAIKILILIAITSVGANRNRARSRSGNEDERSRLQYLNGLVPNFFLSTANISSAEWTSSKTLAQLVLDGSVTQAQVENLGRSLGKLHQLSRKSSLSDRQFSQIRNTFRDNGMQDYVSRMVFTAPFTSSGLANLHPSVKAKAEKFIWNNPRIKSEATRLKVLYDTQEECLIGGHLTAEKTKIKDGVAYVVDPQYAGIGPAAFDVASYLSYFVMAYYHHMLIPENNDYRHRLAMNMVTIANKFVDAYLSEIQVNGNRKEYVEKLMSDTAAFTGVLVVGRCLNAPLTPAIDNRHQTSVEALDSAMRLFERSSSMKSVDRLLTVGLMLIF